MSINIGKSVHVCGTFIYPQKKNTKKLITSDASRLVKDVNFKKVMYEYSC